IGGSNPAGGNTMGALPPLPGARPVPVPLAPPAPGMMTTNDEPPVEAPPPRAPVPIVPGLLLHAAMAMTTPPQRRIPRPSADTENILILGIASSRTNSTHADALKITPRPIRSPSKCH